jgi:dipeptidyl aminopeptidase/acylaminoacyl peptidase
MRGLLGGIVLAVVIGGASSAPAAPPPPPPVESYGKLPAIEFMSLSPSGRRFAFVGVDGDARKLFIETIDNKPLAQAALGNAKIRSIDWAGEDHVLVTISSTADLSFGYTAAKAELFGVSVLNLKTQKTMTVFAKGDRVAHAVFGRYGVQQLGDHWVGYFGGVTYAGNDNHLDHTWPDLYRVDLDTGAAQIAAQGSEILDGWVVDDAGKVVARSTYQEKTEVWQVLAGSDGGRILGSGQEKYGGVDIGLGRTPGTVLIYKASDDGSAILKEVSVLGAESKDLPEPQAVAEPLFDPVSGLWIGYVQDGDDVRTTMFDPAQKAKANGARKAFPDQRVNLESWSADFNTLIVFTSGGDDSGTHWLVNIPAGKAKPLGAAHPAIRAVKVGPTRMVAWKAADGLAMRGVLTLPPGRPAENLPLVVMPHGGPEARDYPEFDWWAQAFASRGYAVFQPNYRGSSGYGLAFRDAGFGQWGRKMQSDISDGVAELAREGIVDRTRACIVGASYGGYAALAGVTVQQGLYRCSVSVAGLSDLAAFLASNQERADYEVNDGERYWKDFMGVTTASGKTLGPISPASLAARADAPILLIHGLDDTVVPIEQSREMAKALKAAGKPAQLITLPGGDHWLLHEDTRLAALKASVAFVSEHNPAETGTSERK